MNENETGKQNQGNGAESGDAAGKTAAGQSSAGSSQPKDELVDMVRQVLNTEGGGGDAAKIHVEAEEEEVPSAPDPDEGICMEILQAVRNELCLNLPYMDVALCSLNLEPASKTTDRIATNGETLYCSPRWVKDRYLRSRKRMNRSYLHVICHCLLRHIWKSRGRDTVLWDIACDAAAEALLEELPYDCIDAGRAPLREQFVSECRSVMKVVTAEGVYLYLLRKKLSQAQQKTLWNAFREDDHQLWTPKTQKQQKQMQISDQKWEEIGRRTQASQSRGMSSSSNGGGIAEQIQVALREDVDYRAFLQRFAAPKEVMKADPESFDYIFYTYGLQLYGNMPLVEPLETKEEKRIEDLIIAVDTSMSTSGEVVRAFLACTYSILRSTETYTRKVNIHILQCDNAVRSDTEIRDLEDLKDYMDHFTLQGGHGTDFRPVFTYADEMIRKGVFTDLRGLIYFTDGLGTYPERRPSYETAFVFLGKAPDLFPVPPWAVRLELDLPDFWNAMTEEEQEDFIQWEDLPEM